MDSIKLYNPKTITFLGGNTFLKEKEFQQILEICQDIQIRIFIDSRWLKNIEKYMDTHNVYVDISIDPSYYTRFKTYEEWKERLDNISEFSKKYSDKFTINMVISKYGYDWTILRKHLGENVTLYVKPLALDNNEEHSPTPIQLNEIKMLMAKEFDRKGHGKKYIKQVDRYLTQIHKPINFRCSCGLRRLTIDWLGRTSFCDALPLSKDWDDKFQEHDEIAKQLASFPNKCLECEVAKECGGSCVILNPPNDFYCWFQKTFIDLAKKYETYTRGNQC